MKHTDQFRGSVSDCGLATRVRLGTTMRTLVHTGARLSIGQVMQLQGEALLGVWGVETEGRLGIDLLWCGSSEVRLGIAMVTQRFDRALSWGHRGAQRFGWGLGVGYEGSTGNCNFKTKVRLGFVIGVLRFD